MPETDSHLTPQHRAERMRALAGAWTAITANERSSFQTWLLAFCRALGVQPPDPPSDEYRFELPVRAVDREGRESTNFIDCWKAGHFAIEAKAFAEGKNTDAQLRKAYGQLRNYIAHVSGDAPPYLMVVDVPRTLIVWDRWSGAYGDFAAGRRIALASLHERPDDIALLYDIFERPHVRDPRGRAQAVTREIAGGLAELAGRLEDRGLETERVARFLMRCVFSCFAEDVGLLPPMLFRRTLETARQSGDADHLARALTSLWQTMDSGGMFGAELLHRFNGHFFRTVEALPLDGADITLLIEAAKHDWAQVEPSIFGTLLVRALDPEERHRLGAEYTPREYIERLVEPTVVEPIREKWTAVQAAVLQLEATERKRDRTGAVKQLREFHEWMRGLRFLDPACGSGNFLYVTMAAVKRIELEVLNEIDRLSGGQGGLVLEEVHPRQFHGIEVKPWAREIAELTLWIGYHQFWRESHGGRTPPDPILEDTGTIECRDAVLAWGAIVHRPERDRPDPTPRIVHPVTGELVPDPAAKLKYFEYVGVRQAAWPRADFIVGNPPYMGVSRQRDALGDGYIDALRQVYPLLPDSIDFVSYWWHRAADEISQGRSLRAGLITTSSITQALNRRVISLARESGVRVIWAAPDHPWVAEADGAAVRVALSVLARGLTSARLLSVSPDGSANESRIVPQLNDDLTAGADVATAVAAPLRANTGMCFAGLEPTGRGFLLESSEAAKLLNTSPELQDVLRPYCNGRDLADRPRNMWIVDFGTRDEAGARAYPRAFQLIQDRVKPERDANADARRRTIWWQFGRNNPELRAATASLPRFIVTVKTSRRRFFAFLSNAVPDSKLNCIALDEAFHLGVLSSRFHLEWSLVAGGRLGVGNDPTYNKESSFDPFPFPVKSDSSSEAIAALSERLDAYRKSAIGRDDRVTMTGMYNVVEKLRSGAPLTTKERAIHEIAACGVLRDLHDELDARVAEAYGWPWPMEKEEILERLVALHDERVEEEKRGIIRWLRPDYQIPRFAPKSAASTQATLSIESAATVPQPGRDVAPWPPTAVEQLSAITALLAMRALSVDQVVASFANSRRDLVERHLETLALMGEITRDETGRYQAARKVA